MASLESLRPLLLRQRNRIPKIDRPPAFAHIVPVPTRNLKRDIAADNALAPQARVQRQPRCHIQPVRLVLFHLAHVCVAALNYDMASGTGIDASTGMLDVKAEMFGQVQQA